MLVILYGLISRMGEECRQQFYDKGFQRVEKYNYAINPQLSATYGAPRRFVSKATFRKNTDPVFRYEVGGIAVGFDRQQITRAVNDETHSLLTLATDDITVLKEIKRIYGEKARLVYVYIDAVSLQQLVADDKKSPEETAQRLEIGRQVKECYLQNSALFDDVLIYGGDQSQFNTKHLGTQITALIERYMPERRKALVYGDVVIPCAPEDKEYYEILRDTLLDEGVDVFANEQLSEDPDKRAEELWEAIQQAKMVLPIYTRAFSRAEKVNRAFVKKAIQSHGKRYLAITFSSRSVPDSMTKENEYQVERRRYFADLCNAAHMVATLLEEEENVKDYARRVESFLKLAMYEQAQQYQRMHLEVCCAYFPTLVPYSLTKLVSILVVMGNGEGAVHALVQNMDRLTTLPDALMDGVVAGGRQMGLTVDKLCGWVERTHTHWGEQKRTQRIDMLRLAYQAAWERGDVSTAPSTSLSDEATRVASPAETEIAELGEEALHLFEQVVRHSLQKSRQDLKDGYQRIIDYCSEVRLQGTVPETCYERIAALDDERLPRDAEGALTAENTALKVYLGKAYPTSGYYDAFISYKSVNENLARDVYNYLTSIGKVVFFAPETLHVLGNSDYTTEIMKAVEHAQNMILVGDTPGYLNADWVRKEWEAFLHTMRTDGANRNLVVVMADQEASKIDKFPQELRDFQIVRMSRFKEVLPNYLRIGDGMR